MSDNKPSIFAFCPAGCKWETVHKTDVPFKEVLISREEYDNLETVDGDTLYFIYDEDLPVLSIYNVTYDDVFGEDLTTSKLNAVTNQGMYAFNFTNNYIGYSCTMNVVEMGGYVEQVICVMSETNQILRRTISDNGTTIKQLVEYDATTYRRRKDTRQYISSSELLTVTNNLTIWDKMKVNPIDISYFIEEDDSYSPFELRSEYDVIGISFDCNVTIGDYSDTVNDVFAFSKDAFFTANVAVKPIGTNTPFLWTPSFQIYHGEFLIYNTRLINLTDGTYTDGSDMTVTLLNLCIFYE